MFSPMHIKCTKIYIQTITCSKFSVHVYSVSMASKPAAHMSWASCSFGIFVVYDLHSLCTCILYLPAVLMFFFQQTICIDRHCPHAILCDILFMPVPKCQVENSVFWHSFRYPSVLMYSMYILLGYVLFFMVS